MRYFILFFLLACISVVGILGFQGSHSRRPQMEIFPDMVRQNKVRPQTPSDFFPDHQSSRRHPEGTIDRAKPYEINGQAIQIDGKPVYPYEESAFTTGHILGTTNWVLANPLPINRQVLDRGQQRYQINCMPCHGPAGDGKGITSKYGMISMANFHDKRLVEMADGEIFNTITHGKNLMGAYGPNVTLEDRWAIIYYVRALERSQLSSVDDVPEQERAEFKK